MPGIRVRSLPKQVPEKDLKVHFSNPKHGGGTIKKIYYPLPSNDAVILFEERQVTVVDQVMKHEHPFSGELVEVEPLPENMVYSMIDAKLDAESSVIVQITPALKDEMEYVMAIKITQEPDQTYRLQGNWFQLEWAWHYIDQVMQQQEVIHHKVSKQSQQYAGQPMEVDVSTGSPRNSRSENRTKHQHPSSGNALLNDNKEIESLSYRGDRNTASGDDHSNRESELPDVFDTEKSGVRLESSVRMQSLHDNSDTDDDQYLHGIGHSIPPDSMQSISRPTYDNKRYRDKNDTFSAFSGTESIKLTPGGGAGKSSVDNSIQKNTHHENKTSLQLQSPVSSPSKSSYKSPHSGIEGTGRSTKPSVDAGDQSLGLGKSKFGARLTNIPRHYTEDQLLHTFDIHGLKVTVYYGSLVEEDTEAIVNAANEQLSHLVGISYAIKKARGHEMDDECSKYIIRNGNLKKTQVIHTSGGGGIKALYIMHTVGPMWISHSDLWRKDFIFELTQTFVNCLQYAEDKLRIKTLAFPAISTGVHGAPLDLCVGCFLDAILIFTQQHGSSRRLSDVRLVNNDAEKTNTSIVLMQTLIDSGIESLTEKAVKKFTSKDQDINLLTRHTGHTSFFKTYTTKTSPSYGTTNHGLSDVTSPDRRRSASFSQDSEKKSSTEDKGKGETAVYKTNSNRDDFDPDTNKVSWSASGSGYCKQKERSGSLDRRSKKDPTSDFSKTVNGAWSYRDEGSADGNSPKRHSTTDGKSTTGMPKMKPSLHNCVTEKLKNQRITTGKDRLGVPSSAEYQAFTYKDHKHSATSRTFSDTTEDEEHDYGMRSLPANLHNGSQKGAHSSREKIPSAPRGKLEICAICLDEVKDPKQLPQCKHIFCRPCIQRHFTSSKPSCPTCGALYGKVVGDQPEDGRMSYLTDRSNCLPGYETEDGMIIIKYTFPDGVQKYNHPHPGKRYKGLERKAYLPNSIEGREVLRLLKKAFDARLVFTIGDSKTSGRQDVLTWNDIHHKTSIAGGSTKFGYPDPGYLTRVKDELAAKGIVSDK